MRVHCADGTGFYDVDYGDPLFTFERPNTESLRKLANLLADRRIMPNAESDLPTLARQNARAAGTLDAVMTALAGVLQTDYDENVSESADWDGGFDYIAVESTFIRGAIEILTRLYYHDGPGNLYYGSLVQRVGPSDFLLWVAY